MSFGMNPKQHTGQDIPEKFRGQVVNAIFTEGEYGAQLMVMYDPLDIDANIQPAWYSMGSRKQFVITDPAEIVLKDKVYYGGYVADGPEISPQSKISMFLQAVEASGYRSIPESGDCRWLVGLTFDLERRQYEPKRKGRQMTDSEMLLPVMYVESTGAPSAPASAPGVSLAPEQYDQVFLQLVKDGRTRQELVAAAYGTLGSDPGATESLVQLVNGNWVKRMLASRTIKEEGGGKLVKV